MARAVGALPVREDRDDAACGLAASGDWNDDTTSAPWNGDSDRAGLEVVDDRRASLAPGGGDRPGHLAMADDLLRGVPPIRRTGSPIA